ncbi:hypothetical protein THAOC_30287, partial [Thalassiosira oceanica]
TGRRACRAPTAEDKRGNGTGRRACGAPTAEDKNLTQQLRPVNTSCDRQAKPTPRPVHWIRSQLIGGAGSPELAHFNPLIKIYPGQSLRCAPASAPREEELAYIQTRSTGDAMNVVKKLSESYRFDREVLKRVAELLVYDAASLALAAQHSKPKFWTLLPSPSSPLELGTRSRHNTRSEHPSC